MPYQVFTDDTVLDATDVMTFLANQVVMVFADAASRTSALSGLLQEGMFSYLEDTDAFEKYDGSAWGPAIRTGNTFAQPPSAVTFTPAAFSDVFSAPVAVGAYLIDCALFVGSQTNARPHAVIQFSGPGSPSGTVYLEANSSVGIARLAVAINSGTVTMTPGGLVAGTGTTYTIKGVINFATAGTFTVSVEGVTQTMIDYGGVVSTDSYLGVRTTTP